jgi:hypothetical protein
VLLNGTGFSPKVIVNAAVDGAGGVAAAGDWSPLLQQPNSTAVAIPASLDTRLKAAARR